MGERYQVRCDNCSLDMTVNLGVGMMSKNPEIIAKNLSGNDLELWKTMNEMGDIVDFLGENRLVYCEQCKCVKAAYIVECTKRDGSVVRLGTNCPTCGNRYTRYSDVERVQCPICKKGVFQSTLVGYWD